jgi:hypothetical protein
MVDRGVRTGERNCSYDDTGNMRRCEYCISMAFLGGHVSVRWIGMRYGVVAFGTFMCNSYNWEDLDRISRIFRRKAFIAYIPLHIFNYLVSRSFGVMDIGHFACDINLGTVSPAATKGPQVYPVGIMLRCATELTFSIRQ